MATTTRTIIIPSELDPVAVYGPADTVIRRIEQAFPEVTIIVRGNRIAVVSRSKQTESQAIKAENTIRQVIEAAYTAPLDADGVDRLLDRPYVRDPAVPAVRDDGADTWHDDDRAAHHTRVPGIITMARGVPVRPKTAGQMAYVNAIESHTITFGIGPAGTGKTYLAVAKAVRAFEDGLVRRIILTRPAVEAGENLGFLPGTLSEKVDPYLRPLYDALSDMIGGERLHRYLTDGTIEVAPLAYMRGRTLNDAYVILDEAQNTTPQQMKMFLTRLGFNTRMIITGDITQVDFEVRNSGLVSIEDVLGGIDDIAFVHLDSRDVVRHSLVGVIVRAYDAYSARHGGEPGERGAGPRSRRGTHASSAARPGHTDTDTERYDTPQYKESER